jgi:hypothetical protein
MKLCLFFLGAVTVFSSCYYDVEEELYGGQVCDTPLSVNWSHIKPLIETHCNNGNCHVVNGIGLGVFDSYAGVKAKVDNGSFASRVLDIRDMPGYSLPACDYVLLEAWLDAGAPEN